MPSHIIITASYQLFYITTPNWKRRKTMMDTVDIISHFKMMVVFHIMDRIIAGITDFVQDNCPQCQALDLEYYHECSLDTWFHIHNLRELFPYFYTQCRKTLIGQDEQFEFVIKVQRAIKDRVKREYSELNVPLLMSLVNPVALQDLVTSRKSETKSSRTF